MSDKIGHECGIAVIRLRKPLDYYIEKYGTPMYAVNKLTLLMEKQHNRGQDGAGVGVIKLDTPPGSPFIHRFRSADSDPIVAVRDDIIESFSRAREKNPQKFHDGEWIKSNVPYAGELLMGHLRYGTHGESGKQFCHPFHRPSNWLTRNLMLAGNFNLTNNNELFELLVQLGQHPINMADTEMVLEKFGHFLDEANDALFRRFRAEGLSHGEITERIIGELDSSRILQKATNSFDGGYVIGGMIGHGDLFVLRDPAGIRPAFYYYDDEIVVAASERPQIQTAFDVPIDQVRELEPGQGLFVGYNGKVEVKQVNPAVEKKACSFERIYFSRGTDADIYQERKRLGSQLSQRVLECIDFDLKNTVFSYIPNTAEVAFHGLHEGVRDATVNRLKDQVLSGGNMSPERIEQIMSVRVRVEKLMAKDVKLRTFITNDTDRNELVAQVYDTTYGIIQPSDTLVILDDSIVRGTTLRTSILRILDRLGMKKIIVVSSAPQIRFPDCYGIDMSKLKDFVAFEAVIDLLKESGKRFIIRDVYDACRNDEKLPLAQAQNHVKKLYEPFDDDEISQRIAQILTPEGMNAEVQIIYQSIAGLHQACPNHKGDWYFSGDYPTPGGNRVSNRAFMNYVEKVDSRAY